MEPREPISELRLRRQRSRLRTLARGDRGTPIRFIQAARRNRRVLVWAFHSSRVSDCGRRTRRRSVCGRTFRAAPGDPVHAAAVRARDHEPSLIAALVQRVDAPALQRRRRHVQISQPSKNVVVRFASSSVGSPSSPTTAGKRSTSSPIAIRTDQTREGVRRVRPTEREISAREDLERQRALAAAGITALTLIPNDRAQRRRAVDHVGEAVLRPFLGDVRRRMHEEHRARVVFDEVAEDIVQALAAADLVALHQRDRVDARLVNGVHESAQVRDGVGPPAPAARAARLRQPAPRVRPLRHREQRRRRRGGRPRGGQRLTRHPALPLASCPRPTSSSRSRRASAGRRPRPPLPGPAR
jgi:hypothetical protein